MADGDDAPVDSVEVIGLTVKNFVAHCRLRDWNADVPVLIVAVDVFGPDAYSDPGAAEDVNDQEVIE